MIASEKNRGGGELIVDGGRLGRGHEQEGQVSLLARERARMVGTGLADRGGRWHAWVTWTSPRQPMHAWRDKLRHRWLDEMGGRPQRLSGRVGLCLYAGCRRENSEVPRQWPTRGRVLPDGARMRGSKRDWEGSLKNHATR